MNILILSGSPRPTSITKKMIEAFIEGNNNHHSIKVIDVTKKNIKGCLACEACHKAMGGKCIQRDDMHEVYDALADADMLILASPIYYHNMSGQIKCVIDRFYANMGPFHHGRLEYISFFLASGDPDMYEGALASLHGDFMDFLNLKNLGVFTYNSQKNLDECLNEVKEFGRSIQSINNLKITLNNGYAMPLIGYGTARAKGEECYNSVLKALKLGYRMIDTAQMYQNECEVGKAIKDSGINRRDIFVTTKLYTPSRSYLDAKKGIEESLKNLGLKYIDLMLIHEPYEEAPLMYKALEEAYKEGKLKAIGVSNFNEEFYLDFIKKVEIIPQVNQIESHVYFRRKKLQNCLEAHHTVMESWSTFTAAKKDIFNEPILLEIAFKHHKTVSQVVLNYFVSNNIVVIPKSMNEERMNLNLNSFDFMLDDEDIKKIESLDCDETLFGWYQK